MNDPAVVPKINPSWYKYEEQCVRHFHDTHQNVDAHHWKDVPEWVLCQSGFLETSPAALRQLRRAHYHNANRCVREFGLDAIAVYKSGVGGGVRGNPEDEEAGDARLADRIRRPCRFVGIQAKCYDPDSTLCANTLGTFFLAVGSMRLATEDDVEGLLYHTCKLQEEVAKHFQLHQNKPHGFLRAIQLPAAATEADVQPARKRQRRGGDSTTNAFSVQQPPPQPQLVLRDYQEEAVHVVTEFLGDDGPQSAKEVKKNRIGLLDMPCGTGKTIVLASCLERLPSWCKLVICLSTTQTLTQQNLDRLAPFVSDSILVDSDTSQGATRDHDKIFKALRRATATTTTAPFSSAAAAGERGAGSRGVLLLSSTYASARDVLTAVFAEQHPELAAQTLLVVDEDLYFF